MLGRHFAGSWLLPLQMALQPGANVVLPVAHQAAYLHKREAVPTAATPGGEGANGYAKL